MSRILIIGNREGTNIAGALERAARTINIETRVIESKLAMKAPLWVRRANWWLRGKRPTRLRGFSAHVVEQCQEWKPHFVVAVGIAPLDTRALEAIGDWGIQRLNYLTDDPWNPAHRAGWFLKAVGHYDVVFSTRRSNLADLRNAGANRPTYLPFAYCPDLHFPETATTSDGEDDVIFAGGCDQDRVPVITSLIRAGFRVGLYGSLWDRFRETRPYTRGQADIGTLRRAHGNAKVALCLPRHANRDGHTMRTFELAAMGACVLAEYTEEHREILGEDGEAAVYFRSPAEMLDRTRWLLAHEDERQRLMTAVHARVTGRPNAYKDRLEIMLAVSSAA